MAREMGEVSAKENRKIIGISLPPTLANKVKAEVSRRKIRLNDLFKEMWELYEAQRLKKK